MQLAREATETYGMIQNGPRPKWLARLSGGKDSYTLPAVLHELQRHGLLDVDFLTCNLDQGQPTFPATVLPKFLSDIGVADRIDYRDTYSIVIDKVPEGRAMCAPCSRLHRANLYRIAREEGCTTVVLGHHRDDILKTFLTSMFHGARLAAMPPKLVNEDRDLFLYRPLALIVEADCEKFPSSKGYQIISCELCGSQDGLQRQKIKSMLDGWEKAAPGRRQKMFRALMNTQASHLLDPDLFDFKGLALR